MSSADFESETSSHWAERLGLEGEDQHCGWILPNHALDNDPYRSAGDGGTISCWKPEETENPAQL